MDDATAKKMLSSGKQVSIYYQGDEDSKKGWKKVEPIRIEGEGDDKVMVAYEIEGSTNRPPIKRYIQKKIINWNVLSTVDAKFAKKEKEKEIPAGGKKKIEPGGGKITTSRVNLGKKGNDFCDAITNKRIVKMYYKGDEEESPGWREDVEPVCYGIRKGVNYVRAWVGRGTSVSGDKEGSTKKLPGWRLFREDRIQKWEVNATETFTKEREDYNENDKLMERRYCFTRFSETPDTLNESFVENLKEGSILSTIKEAINIF